MKKLTIFSIAILISTFTYSQYKSVIGKVYAFKDSPLANIKVEAKKSGASVLTDLDGTFSISCEEKDKLIFTGHGFQRYSTSVKKKDSVHVKMVFLEGANNEKIAVGYGHMSANMLSYAISNFKQYNNDFSNYQDIYQLIQGRVPGVEIVNDGGRKHFLIRGVSTTGNSYAICIVDGVYVDDISYISPTWVESIDVIKDGNAIYGARGGNGVVVITTFN